MTSKTEICNLALSHLGHSKEIGNVDTEASAWASACRRFYDIARDTAQRDFDWPFATKIASLGLLEEEPNDEWNYSYQYPSDCIKVRRILSGIRLDTRDSQIPYKIANGDTGRIIFSDQATAQIEYTVKITNPGHWSEDFTLALSYRLAMFIAPRVTRGDPFNLRQAAETEYMKILSDALANAFNEEQQDKQPESEFIRARE